MRRILPLPLLLALWCAMVVAPWQTDGQLQQIAAERGYVVLSGVTEQGHLDCVLVHRECAPALVDMTFSSEDDCDIWSYVRSEDEPALKGRIEANESIALQVVCELEPVGSISLCAVFLYDTSGQMRWCPRLPPQLTATK